MKKIFYCLLLINFQSLSAQDLEWFEGSLVLANGQVSVGKIAMEAAHDLIVFQGEQRMVYPAHQINSIHFYDEKADINRRYISLKNDGDGIRPRYQLYELVLSGKATVLRKIKASPFAIRSDAHDFNYFVQYDQEVVPLRQFQKKILPKLLSVSDYRLENYISQHRLTPQPISAIRIIEFFNALVESNEQLARN